MTNNISAFNQDYKDRQLKRGWVRKFIRHFYLNNITKYVKPNAIDFGCGVGELLKRLPKGSIGLDINNAAVEYCKQIKLDVKAYEPEIDNYQFKNIKSGKFKTFIMCHVLEHLQAPDEILKRILTSCQRLGIVRVIIVVPCQKGFRIDKTHKTFIDFSYIKKHGLDNIEGFKIVHKKYFPFQSLWIRKHFPYNELMIVYEGR